MAKKKVGVNLILTIVALVTAALSFVSLALNFITQKTTTKTLLGSAEDSTDLNLGEWSDGMKNMQEMNDNARSVGAEDVYDLAGWNLARVFLVITLILVGILAVSLVAKFFINNKLLGTVIMVVSALCVVSALVFAIATFVGCGAVSGPFNFGFGEITVKCMANIGVYALTIFAIATGALSIVASRKN